MGSQTLWASSSQQKDEQESPLIFGDIEYYLLPQMSVLLMELQGKKSLSMTPDK